MSPSLDHVIPLAMGGDHVEENLQCAHLICNSTKAANPSDQQLRLRAA
jgi:5-methylcytosine-specific restriction endonuclease McrA